MPQARESSVILSELPPSANNLFLTAANGRRRIKTAAYRAWLALAGAEIRLVRRCPRVAGPVRLAIWVDQRADDRRDLDNVLKPTLDALVTFGVIDGDAKRIVRGFDVVEWAPVDGVHVHVRSVEA